MPETSEMVERVAEAIAAAHHEPLHLDPELYCDMAKAAIRAMREPTEAMIEAAWASALSESAPDVWRDMIDAALPSPTDRR